MSNNKDKDDALLATYSKLPEFSDTLRLFERGVDSGEFVAYGQDARKASAIAYRSESVTRMATDKQTPTVTINRNLLSSLLLGAIQQSLKIEIYSLVDRKYQKTRSASPGSIIEIEDLLGDDNVELPLVACVHVKRGTTVEVGVAFSDSLNKTMGLSEFEDNEVLGNLEAFIIQLGIRELLVQEDDQVSALAARANISTTVINKKDFKSSKDEIVRLSNLSETQLASELARPIACGCASALAKHLNISSVKIVKHDLSQYMRLDSAALKALNVLPSARDQAKSQSLFGLLNHCRTVSGSRLLSKWLKQPLLDIEAINTRLDQVESLINAPGTRESLRSSFYAVPDMTKIVRKFHKRNARLDDVVRIYQLAIRLPDFVEHLTHQSLEQFGTSIAKSSQELAKFVELVETTVDLKGERDFKIRADFDERLVDLEAQKQQVQEKLHNLHQEHGDKLGLELDKKLKLDNHQTFGWCFRLTRGEANILRDHKGYIELATQKAGMLFTTAALKQINTELTEVEENYSKTQSKIVQEIVNIASTYLVILTPLGETLSHLDVLCAFAEASSFAKIPYKRPSMNKSGNTILKAARHPCMEAQDNIQFIPNDVEMKRNESEFLIITGPNMGGKSTYIRQIGVIALMAQIGCFVPCDDAELCVFDCILARVGAGDSQLKGISTFMAEMLETASILKTATKDSLIVIDELGRGTSTYDGFGLAWAISQHIIQQIGCFSMFATHFHELTALANIYPQAFNLHVVADTSVDSDITLLYKVAPGISDKSFGIHVAEVVNFPDKVVRMAKRKAQELEDLDNQEFSEKDVSGGNEMLQGLLKRWVKDVPQDSAGAVKKLRELMESERAELEKQPFLKSLLTSL